jgi:ribonucleoside-triphosphate reductase
MQEKGFPVEDDVTKPGHTSIFSFPIASPDSSVTRNDLGAIQQLQHYLTYKQYWCEHNPSITVYIGEDEWMDVGAWVYGHWNDIGGIAFLPRDNGIYQQAPYQEITKEQYDTLKGQIPEVDWTELIEESDQTTGSQDLACLSGVCEVT